MLSINPSLNSKNVLANSPYLADSLLLHQNGRRKVSRISPSLVYNTVNQPIFPTAGELPVNLLRLYVHFSGPMSEGWANRAVQVRNDLDEIIRAIELYS